MSQALKEWAFEELARRGEDPTDHPEPDYTDADNEPATDPNGSAPF